MPGLPKGGPELEHVPTVAELVALGLASLTPTGKGQAVRYAVTSEGHAMMGAVMRRNGERRRLWSESGGEESRLSPDTPPTTPAIPPRSSST